MKDRPYAFTHRALDCVEIHGDLEKSFDLCKQNKFMDMLKFLDEFSFKESGVIESKNRRIILKPHDSILHHTGVVYIWIKYKRRDKLMPIYVGKTSKTVCDRCRQQTAGFVTSVTGKGNAPRILGHLNKGYKIAIYSRRSAQRSLLGERVSLCESEEKAIIKKLDDAGFKLLNKIKKEKP